MTALKSPSPLVPSVTLMKFRERITSSYGAPILDAPAGFGRNALAFAALGCDIIAVDKDVGRLKCVEKSADDIFQSTEPSNACGRIISVCADLTCNRFPFGKSSFSAILCIHYPAQRIIAELTSAVQTGGHIYIETFGGQGQNYLELPKVGEIRGALRGYELHFYKERPVGPPSHNSVVVTALGQKRR
ncbi:class I SAM-dependent methyltransferase [Bradyrhizobium hipponense]|uniref:Class I SAM-dependent methyltransferase n=1 Tax=Bradyrhizobium hipponense TaxID=2605638 RepID=A0A5S4YCW1_9BRAD|nr:class I SAM-dependent methyltransferase [Bradyrhizobium hipponense]TYO61858.1 class I SAM-dependent methyltransferase [Bradyrhizobium hipponense]